VPASHPASANLRVLPLEPMQSKSFDSILTSLGLALILAGQPIAWWARGTFFDSESAIFPAAAVLIGFGFLVRLRPFAGAQLQVPPWLIGVYALGYLVPIGLLSLVDPVELGDDAAYAFFTALVVFAVAITPLRALQQLAPALTLVGGISSTLPLVELATGDLVETFTRFALKGNNNPLVLGMVGGATVIAALLTLHTSRRRSALIGLGCGAATAAGAAAIVLSNTRSVVLSLIITIPVFYALILPRIARPSGSLDGRKRQLFAFLASLAVSAVAAPSAAVVLLGPELLTDMSTAAVERATGAVAAVTEPGGGQVDRSTQGRIDIFERSLAGLTATGHGINAQIRAQGDVVGEGIYPHFTYLQAFYDFGIAGAIWFALLHLVLPLLLIARRYFAAPLDPATAFIILYYLYSHIDHLTHATPYSWLALMPVALVYALVPRAPLNVTTAKRDPS